MRRSIVISLAILLAVFFAIGCTDTGSEERTDDKGSEGEVNDTEVVPVIEDEESIDAQAVNQDGTASEEG
ncbi:hypothetical protein [Methanolobus chelungpuianus]|uniref:Uncharacterized protein n=1 Tax=Methanolobus chelungpuianus TaxID=502115 RepID=A0AAE3L1C3_9EURY|nr:hypothetical protein [Methanolobus chelungpuianus]MCQ6963023.1 hypothetical protein [Methanolobus chelungpuianus]